MRWLALFLLLAIPAHAALDPREMLPDPAQEARARAIGKELRCLVCQNQSIDDSNADLARDLRVLVRERIAAGDSDDAVRRFVVARYGEYVLLTPPFNARTAVLWIGPGIVLLAALVGAAAYLRRRRVEAPPAPLSDAERKRLAKLLEPQP
jgi:cytochrome c-type biogenesis protein CcmH